MESILCLVLPSIHNQKGETKAVQYRPGHVSSNQAPFQVLVLLSTFKTVIVSSSVIVSSIIRQSFSTCSTLCQTFVIVLLNSEIQLQLCHLRR